MESTEQQRQEHFLRRNTYRLLNSLSDLQNGGEIGIPATAEEEDEENDGSVFGNRFLLFFFFLWNVAVGAHFVPVLWVRIRRQERCGYSLVVRMFFAAPALAIGIAMPILYGYSKQGVAGVWIVFGLTIFVPYFGWFMCITGHGGGDDFDENPLLACCFCCRPPHLYPPPATTSSTGRPIAVGSSSSSPRNVNAIMAIGDDSFHEPISISTLYKRERELLILNTIIVCKVRSATETDAEKEKLPNDFHSEEGVEISNGDDADANLSSSSGDEISDPLDEVDIAKDRLKETKESFLAKVTTPDNNAIPNPPSTETDETTPSSDSEGVIVSSKQEKSDIILAPTTTTSDDHLSEDNVSIQQCYICLEDYKPGDEIAWSQNPACRHAFHKDCLVGWLMSHAECPVCRNTYDYEEELRA